MRAKRDQKLQIFAPGGEDANRAFIESIAMTGLICTVMAMASLQLFWREPAPTPPEPGGMDGQPLTDAQKTAINLTGADQSVIDATQWDAKNSLAVFEHGPRLAAERACEANLKTLTPEAAAMLEAALQKRAIHAPRICLVRAWFNKELASHDALAQAVERYWEDVEEFAEPALQTTMLVNEYRKTRQRPEDERYYRWLRECAMASKRDSWEPCLLAIRQLSPMQGGDVLGMIELHLQEAERFSVLELGALTTMLGKIARNGQPGSWKVQESGEVKELDRDIRFGAVFYLCRMVHSSDEQVATAAAEGLEEASDLGGRGAYKLRLERWREACMITYGGKRPGLEFVELPDLANNEVPQLLIKPDEEGAFDYSMRGAVAQKHCETRPKMPIWDCGVQLWTSPLSIPKALEQSFIDSRYMEWTTN